MAALRLSAVDATAGNRLVGGGFVGLGAYQMLLGASRSVRFALLGLAVLLWAWSVRRAVSQPEPDFERAGIRPRWFWVTVTAALGPLGALAYVIYALPRIVDARPSSPIPGDRIPVWAALAWPYLDTEPDDATAKRAATALLACGKPMDEIWRIDREEVAPALWNEGWYGDWFVIDDANDPVLQRIHAHRAADLRADGQKPAFPDVDARTFPWSPTAEASESRAATDGRGHFRGAQPHKRPSALAAVEKCRCMTANIVRGSGRSSRRPPRRLTLVRRTSRCRELQKSPKGRLPLVSDRRAVPASWSAPDSVPAPGEEVLA